VHKALRVPPSALVLHPNEAKRRRQKGETKGDELVFMTEDQKAARDGMYAVKIDPQFWYDQAIERVFDAKNEFEVLGLPVAYEDDATVIKRAYRKTSLHVHPDKNRHPQAEAAFKKAYGAFETLSDPKQQRRLLWELGSKSSNFTEEEEARFAGVGGDDEDDETFQWWWEATVSDVEKAAAEAEGSEMDSFAAMWISDGLGGDVDDVRWVGLTKARELYAGGLAIFLDVRTEADFMARGYIPGAFNISMERVGQLGIVAALGNDLIHELLSKRRHALIIVVSAVATPFSRCRAFCRYMLRAGHSTLPSARFRRLRGGMLGWKCKGGPTTALLK